LTAAVDVAPLRIAQHTRHKSLEMVNRYCREADKFSKSALKGVFSRADAEEECAATGLADLSREGRRGRPE